LISHSSLVWGEWRVYLEHSFDDFWLMLLSVFVDIFIHFIIHWYLLFFLNFVSVIPTLSFSWSLNYQVVYYTPLPLIMLFSCHVYCMLFISSAASNLFELSSCMNIYTIFYSSNFKLCASSLYVLLDGGKLLYVI
jgi:hypothetical protein